MELALYCPDCGYYEKNRDTPGRRGDFYTSVSVGKLFGELLAFRFAEWLKELPLATGRWQIAEAGAHDGRLAADILAWLRLRRPELFDRIEYVILEPSSGRREWQREMLKEFAPRVRWLESDIPDHASRTTHHASRINGIIFSNELLDALPVHRLGWDAHRRKWFEWGVTLKDERFVWTRLGDEFATGHRASAISRVPPELLDVLPDGFTAEICPAAEDWWQAAARALQRGKLLTLDYGLSAGEFFSPQRAGGTLRAYHRHRLVDDALANPGEQDLTTHVNFSAIQQAGEAAGLRTETLASQAQFLTGIAQRVWQPGSDFGGWTPERTRQFQTLTHPELMGRAFRVLVQASNGG